MNANIGGSDSRTPFHTWTIRRTPRFPGWSYSLPGPYFVTICTRGRRPFFGMPDGGGIRLTPWGEIAQAVWQNLERVVTGITRDAFVVMPNHVHFIVWLCAEPSEEGAGSRGALSEFPRPGPQRRRPLSHHEQLPGRPKPYRDEEQANQRTGRQELSLGDLVRIYKAITTRQIRQAGLQEFSWQRNYYEHIIRNEQELERIREYIASNPSRWPYDQENPTALQPVDSFPWDDTPP